MALHSPSTALDQKDRGQNEESAGQGCETYVAEVVPQDDEQRYHSQTNPARQAAQLFAGTHGLVSAKVTANDS
jgi:hypothetical protein